MFERLMNLDVELMCLRTNDYVARQRLLHGYSKSSKVKNAKAKDDVKESLDVIDKIREIKKTDPNYNPFKDCETLEDAERIYKEISNMKVERTSDEKPQEAKLEPTKSAADSLKVTLREYGDVLSEVAKLAQSDEELKAIDSELRDALNDIKESLKKGEIPKLTDMIQVQEEDVIDVEVPRVVDEPKAGPDFSGLQQGVVYHNGPMMSQDPQLRPATEETLNIALEKANKNKK